MGEKNLVELDKLIAEQAVSDEPEAKKACSACHDDGLFCSVCGTEVEGGPVDRQGRHVGDDRWFYCNRFQWEKYKDDPAFEVRELFTRPLAPTEPVESEPVACRWSYKSGDWHIDTVENAKAIGTSESYRIEYLYTHPAEPVESPGMTYADALELVDALVMEPASEDARTRVLNAICNPDLYAHPAEEPPK